MSTEVAKLVARLEADVRDFERGMKSARKQLDRVEKDLKGVRQEGKKTTKTTDGMASGLKKFAAAAGVAFAVKQVFDFGRAAVNAASDLQESINAVNVTFGDAADGILKIGEGAADALGLSNAEFNSLAVSFSAFTEKIAGAEGRSVVAVMDELTTRAADFASVMNLDVAEAATLFRSGLAGEAEALRRFGIDVSAAAVNLKAMELGLAGSSAELTEQDKILARYHLIMEQTQKTQGDFANTSDSFANGMRRLQAAFEDAKAEIGEQLLPVLEKLIPVAIDVVKWIGSLALEFGNLLGVISDTELAAAKTRRQLDESATSTEHFAATTRRLSVGIAQMSRDTKTGRVETEALGKAFTKLITETSDLRGTFNLTGADVAALRDGTSSLITELGLTEEQVLMLVEALEAQSIRSEENTDEFMKMASATGQAMDAFFGLNEETEDGEKAARRYKRALVPMTKEIISAEQAHDRVTAAIRRQIDEIRALTDPTFRLRQSMKDLAAAQKEYETVLADSKSTVEDQEDALFGLLEAQLAVNADAANYAAVNGPKQLEAFKALAEQLGLDEEAVRQLLAALQQLDGFTAFAEVHVAQTGNVTPGTTFETTNPSSGVTTTVTFAQHGGRIGGPAIVGEAGRELFIPDQPGTILAHSETEAALRGGNETHLHFHNEGVIGSQAELQQWVQEAIEEARRINAS